MNKEDYIIAFLTIGLIVIALFAVSMGLKYTCYEQTKRMGYNHDWGFFSGCMIEKKPGQWIPLDVYRGFEE